MQKILPKNKLAVFLDSLVKRYDVVAPVKNGNTKFCKISLGKDVYLDRVTDIPAKNHFMPEGEVLVEFSSKDDSGDPDKGKVVESEGKIRKSVLFGLRRCDLNAIDILDKVMYDPQYLAKRKNTVLVGLFCDNPDEFCFCNSMELTDFYDLFFYPKGDYYYIDIGSKKGAALVKRLPDARKDVKIPLPKNWKKLKTKDIEKNYRDDVWKKDVDKCLSCSACTVVCPTCNCFDIKDELDIGLKSGRRIRRQASCQLKNFSRVAGGKSYRDSRLSRFKHFVYHKIVYYKKQKGRPMCVGCGRCLRICPTGIDWTETINKLKGKRS